MLRWAFANTIFCFVVFTLFAILIYQLTMSTFINEEKRSLLDSMDSMDRVLSNADQPLTLNTLHRYIDFTSVPDVGERVASGEGQQTEVSYLWGQIGLRRAFFIYGLDHKLIYSTSSHIFGLEDNIPDNEVREVEGQTPGLLVSRQVISSSTGEAVGYLQFFYDLTFYHRISNQLLISLLILEVLALMIAQFIGYFMAHHFMKPLETLHHRMQAVANDPTTEFQPIQIHTGDEIEELANVYNEMRRKTTAYLEQQKRFVSDVSHELRTPLAVLDGNINLLRRWGKDDPEVLEESLEASRDEIRRMKNMLEEMLALARLENIDLDAEQLDCDVVKVCTYTMRNFQLIHEDFELKLDNQLTSGTHAKIYENHYEQGILILMDNAAKYSPEDRKSITLTLSEDEKYIITSVTDKGIGISEEDIDHVFERFFRADKSRNRDIEGTGLGLSIISRLIENYRGEVEVTSKLGVGSTFTLKIPKLK